MGLHIVYINKGSCWWIARLCAAFERTHSFSLSFFHLLYFFPIEMNWVSESGCSSSVALQHRATKLHATPQGNTRSQLWPTLIFFFSSIHLSPVDCNVFLAPLKRIGFCTQSVPASSCFIREPPKFIWQLRATRTTHTWNQLYFAFFFLSITFSPIDCHSFLAPLKWMGFQNQGVSAHSSFIREPPSVITYSSSPRLPQHLHPSGHITGSGTGKHLYFSQVLKLLAC